MAGKSPSEKIDELAKLVATLVERLDNTIKTLDALNEEQKRTNQAHNDIRREHERELAVLKEKTEKLEAAQERAGNRAWAVVPSIIGAIIGGLITAVVAAFVRK
jgi:hypothetical protein